MKKLILSMLLVTSIFNLPAHSISINPVLTEQQQGGYDALITLIADCCETINRVEKTTNKIIAMHVALAEHNDKTYVAMVIKKADIYIKELVDSGIVDSIVVLLREGFSLEKIEFDVLQKLSKKEINKKFAQKLFKHLKKILA